MAHPGTNSLQRRLVLRLGILFLLATLAAAGLLWYQTLRAASTMSNQWLLSHAQLLAEGVDASGRFALPGPLVAMNSAGQDSLHYLIRDASGTVLAASGPEVERWGTGRSVAVDSPRFAYFPGFGQGQDQAIYGLDILLDSAAGPLSLTLAGVDESGEALIHGMLEEFLFEILWIFPVFIMVTLLVGVNAVKSSLRPLTETAARAGAIRPEAIAVRLSTTALPEELLPLVKAINSALDRLQSGFEQQRQFTANAAHQLRTPLTIITGALENMDADKDVTKLRRDVARMNRLVDQLLRVARLDSLPLDTCSCVDLRDCAGEVIETLAPLAIANHRSLALGGVDKPVLVKGDAHAIFDALSNLVENAITHTREGTSVDIMLEENGSVHVIDHGPGIAPEEAKSVFERFYRGRHANGAGAGLGLAIVRETMKVHGGSVAISTTTEGSACITLHFQLWHPEPPEDTGKYK
jgi:two-component system, OmpR family, sensor histidine kinase TctE